MWLLGSTQYCDIGEYNYTKMGALNQKKIIPNYEDNDTLNVTVLKCHHPKSIFTLSFVSHWTSGFKKLRYSFTCVKFPLWQYVYFGVYMMKFPSFRNNWAHWTSNFTALIMSLLLYPLCVIKCIMNTIHYSDVIMGQMASQITSLTIVYSSIGPTLAK